MDRLKRLLLLLCAAGLYLLHQDTWNWTEVHPLILGVVPVGLFYHFAYSLACAVLMWMCVTWAWPADLEGREESPSDGSEADGGARP